MIRAEEAMTNSANERLPRMSAKSGVSTIMTILLLGLSILAAAFIAPGGTAASLNSVQVTIQTTKNLPFQYGLTAYNTSGYQVAYFYGNYPEAAFGLPSGTYLITASAYYQPSVCNPCLLKTGTANSTKAPVVASYMQPYSEYGYAVEEVDGPTQITIATRNSTETSLVNLPVHVEFFNGTAAVNASVSAYVVGSNYAYSPDWVTYGQVGEGGNVTLVLPDEPVQITASMSVPIHLPQSVSVVTVQVGGQKVNVTVYWQPNYVNLAGQILFLPPQKGAEITLKVQQSSSYPVYYTGVTPAPGSVTTVTTTFSTATTAARQGVSSSQSNNIAPFSPTKAQLSPSQQTDGAAPGTTTTDVLIAGVGALALIGVSVALVLGRKRETVQGARP